MPVKSIAENPWMRLLIGPGMTLAVVGMGLFFTVREQGKQIVRNTDSIASNAETLATLSQELPLIRQALDRDNELINLVVEGIKRDFLILSSRVSDYIRTDNEEQALVQERLHDLEMQVHVYAYRAHSNIP